MKKLERMFLLNWHNFTEALIPFEDITFLTGKNSSGKSTLIDAMQLVLLGDTTGNFFNKAANQKSTRTLESYLYGEQGDDGEAGFRYKRSDHFMTYIVLEFHDLERDTFFVAGFAAECYKDMKAEHLFFIAPRRLPPSLFQAGNVPLDRNGLKNWLKEEDGKYYQTNTEYRKDLLVREGPLHEKYLSLLRKAVPFVPMNDITRFITEYVCDVDTSIDVEKMQSDIRKYTQLEHESEQMSIRIKALEKIHSADADCIRMKDVLQSQKYILDRSLQDKLASRLSAARNEYQNKCNEKESLALRKSEADKALKAVRDEIEGLKREFYSSSAVIKESELKKEIGSVRSERMQCDNRLKRFVSGIHAAGIKCKDYITSADETGITVPDPPFILEDMLRMDYPMIEEFPFAEAGRYLKDIRREAGHMAGRERARIEELRKRDDAISATISELEKGRKPFPDALVRFREKLEDIVGHECKVLADTAEVLEQEWRDAAEGYLGDHRFDLLLSPADYAEAEKIFGEFTGSGVAIVDVSSIPESVPLDGSLYEAVDTDDEDTDRYLRFLIGNVIKGDSGESHILPDSVLFENSRLSAISSSIFSSPFLGREALRMQIERLRAELVSVCDELAVSEKRLAVLSKAEDIPEFPSEDNVAEALSDSRRLPELDERLTSLQTELSSLDMMYADNLRRRIDGKEKEEGELSGRRDRIIECETELRVSIENLASEVIPELEKQAESISEEISGRYEAGWVDEAGEPRYQKEKAADRNNDLYDRYSTVITGTETRIRNLIESRNKLRSEYNAQFQLGLNPERDDNSEYDSQLEDLREVKLPEYLEKIRSAKRIAEVQFRDDFIAKIKDSISSIQEQIRKLNSTLRSYSFGRDRYHFSVTKNKDYGRFYDMFMDDMLMKGRDQESLFQDAFVDKFRNEINELFSAIIIPEGGRSSEQEAALKRYTDYRTYLSFDLIVEDTDNKTEQRLSVMMGKKSGGETQLPFYISLLASFAQVCGIRKQNTNTVRLIILDEAFSKMDGERIRESVKLLREIGLQAVFSAPPEKLADIDPLVDETLIALRYGSDSFIRRKKRVAESDNA